ncbi:hypothetical protein BDK51DRAFT_15972 [Blyttiomyces helicus]|uniref:Plastocyanin-like domain-containing protein n=1 Tax=Blyttiomyces helicus TaxID=388810 RepID=A0A4P9VYW8_9FUNG|nr:hypothetical protein BDK51DRAFT_15972 [Blyttiomyces helicus]|eukprot:RKO83963.1 hypothetical protein BDK51DRAFT_15972 [Blyttiomyces helicus]
MLSVHTGLVALTCLSLARAARVVEYLNITYVDGVNPDGRFLRRVIGVNGIWPPPQLNATYNDTLVLHVVNIFLLV